MELTDTAAAEQARQGDQHAFRVLVERHSRALFRLTYRMTQNEQDAEDLVQETFLRAYKQLQRFDGRSAFSTWLHRIAVNCSLDLLRARKNRREQQTSGAESPALHWLDQIRTPDPSPERLSQSGEILSLLAPALEQLSEMERTAFLLRHYEDASIAEIAQTLNVEANAAKHSVFRAVQKLRRALQPVWEGAQ
jgi:RNA polymerase sigma-70 factor (ECF subfamily)